MDPITLALLASAAIAKGTGTVIQAQQMKEAQKPVQERISELEELERRGRLGLTGQEEAVLTRKIQEPGRAIARERLQQQQALSRASAASGEVLASLIEQEEADRAAMDRASAAVAQADVSKRQAQEAELQDLSMQLAQMEAQRRSMIVGGATSAVSEGLGAAGQYMAMNEYMNRIDAAELAAAEQRKEAQDLYNLTMGREPNNLISADTAADYVFGVN